MLYHLINWVLFLSQLAVAQPEKSSQHQKLLSTGACVSKQSFVECTGDLKSSSYKKAITLYISEQLDPLKPVKLSLFFHGHRTSGKSWKQDVLDRFHFEDHLEKINDAQLVLILPQSEGKNTDHEKYFGETYTDGSTKYHSRLNEFIDELSSLLTKEGFCNNCEDDGFEDLILSGHSGAYTVLFGILNSTTLSNMSLSRINFIDSMYTKYPARYQLLKDALIQNSSLKARVLSLSSTKAATDKMKNDFLNDSHVEDMTFVSQKNIPDVDCYSAKVCIQYPKNKNMTHSSIVNESFSWLSL